MSKVCKTYNEEIFTFTKAAVEQTDMLQMKLLLTRGNDQKPKCEEPEFEIKKLDETLVTLHKKRKEVNKK